MAYYDYKCTECGTIQEDVTSLNEIIKCNNESCNGLSQRMFPKIGSFKVNGYNYGNGYSKK